MSVFLVGQWLVTVNVSTIYSVFAYGGCVLLDNERGVSLELVLMKYFSCASSICCCLLDGTWAHVWCVCGCGWM